MFHNAAITANHVLLSFFTASTLLFSNPAHAQDTTIQEPTQQPENEAFFSLTNLGGSFDFSEEDWRWAVANTPDRVYWKIDRDTEMVFRVMEVAASTTPVRPFAAFYAINLREDQADTFDVLLDSIVAQDSDPAFAGAKFVYEAPLCRLMQVPEIPDNALKEYYVASVEMPKARKNCYFSIIQFVLDNADAFEPPTLDRVVVDSAAVFAQAVLPTVSVKESGFIDPETWSNDRQPVPRSGENVFEAGELILLHAILENVGRDMAGTPLASYEIRLDVVIEDETGTIITDQEDVMRFSGLAIHSVPIRPDYFETGVVTGFPLQSVGSYSITYQFVDLNRAGANSVTEVSKVVIVQ